VEAGEIGVPVFYAEEFHIKVGNNITLKEGGYNKEFTVSTIIRDASMNAALTSSKRFLISNTDMKDLSQNMGEWEYCFEFLLKDRTQASVLQKDYVDGGLPQGGVAVTGSLLTMLNALSYGLVAFIIIAISFLLIIIALLCLSYIIRATLAEENVTIGEMKAIGFSTRAIERLYLTKYIILTLLAGIVGYILAIPFGNFFSKSVVRYCGYGTKLWGIWIYPFIGILLLGLIVILKCQRILRKNLKGTVIQLMHQKEQMKKEGHFSLPAKGMSNRNVTMALGELKCKWKEYVVLFFVFVFATFLILLPMNMKNTIENPNFITYMGVGKCDVRIDLQYSENLIQQKDTILSYLRKDSDISKYSIYENGYVQLQNKEGELDYVRIQNGDESVFELSYLEGNAPANSQEIALSSLEASQLDKKVGDNVTGVYQGKELTFLVSGIYQDITYGGKTAKAAVDFAKEDVDVYIIYLDVLDGVSIPDKVKELRGILTDGKITPISEFVSQTLGGITKNLTMVEVTSIIISFLLITLITAMFLQLITAREHKEVAIKKAMGFSNDDIRTQFGIRILVIQLAAILTGTILANSLGESIFGLMLSSVGASRIELLIEPVKSYLLCPILQIIIVVITVILGTKVVRNYHIRNQIME
jgi:putative ABC transport system permease protein